MENYDGVSYDMLSDVELNEFVKEIEFKKEMDIQHEKLMNGEVETMSIDDFSRKHSSKYGL